MLATKYKSEFLKIDKNKEFKSVMERIVQKEKEYEVDCINWSVEQIEDFLKDLHSISPNTISRALIYLREFAQYVCKQEQIDCPEYKLEHGKLYDLVDYKKLDSTTITYEQYKHTKNQLDLNVRDKLILELAWNMLGNEEIKNLKEKDIEFKESEETGMEYALLHLSETRPVRIEDPEVVEDIKKCIKEKYFFIEDKNGVSKRNQFKFSEYLIKPSNVGKSKKEYQISNPGVALQKAIEQQEVTCPDVDVSEITIESVRRSKLIFLLAPQNEKYFDTNLIMAMLDSGNVESNLLWLKKVAKIKYGK